MRHIGMTLAVVVWGGVLFTADEAGACEAHRAQAKAAQTTPAAAEPVAREEAATKQVAPAQEPHAAKCQCGSAADCTCKKGTCECAKCKRRAQEAQGALEAQVRAPQAERLARASTTP